MKSRLIAIVAFALVVGIAFPAARAAFAAPEDAESTVVKAREAARQGRNAESMALFEQAIAEDPSRRMALLPELADQMTYAGFAEEAVPLYEEYFSEGSPSPEDARRARLGRALALSWSDDLKASLREYDALLADDPDDREAQIGRARVLSWLDRQGPSREAYEEVLTREPGNIEARRGLGRVQSWRGRQRAAQEGLEKLLRDHPNDSEAVFLLAQSQYWMGRPDKARDTLNEYLVTFPDDDRARALLDDIDFAYRPSTLIDYQESHQSDNLTILAGAVAQDYYLGGGRTLLSPRYEHYYYRQNSASVKRIRVNRPGARIRHRISDSLEWNGSLFVDLIDLKGRDRDHETLTYDTYLTFWPNDLLRFDIGSNRTTFDNMKSLTRNITATAFNLSMDVTPDEKTRLSGRFRWADYTDGNEQRWGQFEAERRLWNHPKILAGYRFTGFDFTRLLDNGYFNPNTYTSNELTMRTYGQLGDHLYYDFDGSFGVEQDNPGRDKAIWSAGTRVRYRIVDRLELEGRYQYFSSSTASSGGFERGTAGVNLRFTW